MIAQSETNYYYYYYAEGMGDAQKPPTTRH